MSACDPKRTLALLTRRTTDVRIDDLAEASVVACTVVRTAQSRVFECRILDYILVSQWGQATAALLRWRDDMIAAPKPPGTNSILGPLFHRQVRKEGAH